MLLSKQERVYCIVNGNATVFDFDYKWAETLGHSLNYATQTNRNATLALIRTNSDSYTTQLSAILERYELELEIVIIEF